METLETVVDVEEVHDPPGDTESVAGGEDNGEDTEPGNDAEETTGDVSGETQGDNQGPTDPPGVTAEDIWGLGSVEAVVNEVGMGSLRSVAGNLGLSKSGSKPEIAARILEARPFTEPQPAEEADVIRDTGA